MSIRAQRPRGTPSSYKTGGWVRETGLAVLHQDEFVVPAHDAHAVIEAVLMKGQGVVNFYFPVEVTITGRFSKGEREELMASIWDALSDPLNGAV